MKIDDRNVFGFTTDENNVNNVACLVARGVQRMTARRSIQSANIQTPHMPNPGRFSFFHSYIEFVMRDLAVALAIILCACAGDDSGDRARSGDHPISLATDGIEPSFTLEKLWEIGSLDGDPVSVFGRISDVAVIRDSLIAVVDQYYDHVRVYGRSGAYKFTLGRPGSGPGEFVEPVALAWDSLGNVYVADRGTYNIEHFRIVRDSAVYVGSIRSTARAASICSTGGRLWYHASRGTTVLGGIIAALDSTGAPTVAMGAPYPHPNPGIREPLSEGLLICSRQAVLFVPRSQEVISAYALDGTLLWQTRIPEFRAPRVVRSDGVDAIEFFSEEGIDINLTSALHDSLLMVQTVRRGDERTSVWDFRSMRTHLIRTSDGAMIGRYTDRRPLIWAVGNDLAIAVEHVPFPKISAYRISL